MNVLLATDGSRESMTALGTVGRFFAPEAVSIVCVTPEMPELSRARERYARKMEEETQRILRMAQEAFAAEGIQATAVTGTGSPAETIARLSVDFGVTVVGAKGLATERDIGLGPVASRVLEHADGSVLVGRPLVSATGYRALIAVDGSAAGYRAISTAVDLLNLEAADLTLLHVVETPWMYLGTEEGLADFEDEIREPADPETLAAGVAHREAFEVVERARDLLRPARPGVETKIEDGLPSTEILGEAERGEYDLVVVGASRADDFRHEMLGSVSAKVAYHASCSVLVIR